MSKPKRQKTSLHRKHAELLLKNKSKANSLDMPAEAAPAIRTGSGQRGYSDNPVLAIHRDYGFSGVFASLIKQKICIMP